MIRSRRPRRPTAARRGMTLVEVIVAIVILTGATLALGAFVSRFAHATSVAELRATAVELAADRLEAVRQAHAYATLAATYAGVEGSLAEHPGFRRTTLVTRVTREDAAAGGVEDYAVVTVVVSHAALRAPVRKSTVVSAF